MYGWIRLYRELLDNAIWVNSKPEQKVILITLLLMANHKENKWEWKNKKYTAEPGQFVTSLKNIKEKCGKGITIQHVRTALNRFQKLGFITNESTNQNRLITIVNWGVYQTDLYYSNKHFNKQLTSDSQANNNYLTTNNNERIYNDINKEEINILNQRNDSFGLLYDFLFEKGCKEELIINIIRECEKTKLMKFSLNNLESQYSTMMEKIQYGEVDIHNGFAKYFVNGLKMRTEQAKLNNNFIERNKSAQGVKRQARKLPMYNWLEEKSSDSIYGPEIKSVER